MGGKRKRNIKQQLAKGELKEESKDQDNQSPEAIFTSERAYDHTISSNLQSFPSEIVSLIQQYTPIAAHEQLIATSKAFAAVLSNGKIFTWGDANFGGVCNFTCAQIKDFDGIYGSMFAFVAKTIQH